MSEAKAIREEKIEKRLADEYAEFRQEIRAVLREFGVPSNIAWTNSQIIDGFKRVLKEWLKKR